MWRWIRKWLPGMALGTVLAVFLVLALVFTALTDSTTVVQPFSVSGDVGMSGDDLGDLLVVKINKLTRTADIGIKTLEPQFSLPREVPEVATPSGFFSSRPLIGTIGYVLGLSGPHVRGSAVAAHDSVRLRIRLGKADDIAVHGRLSDLDSLVTVSAKEVLGTTNPYVVAVFESKVGDTAEALRLIERALRSSPKGDDAGAMNLRGAIKMNRHQVGEAIRDFEDAIEIRPSLALGYRNLAWALLLQNSTLPVTDTIIGLIQRAHQLDPRNPLILTDVGRIVSLATSTRPGSNLADPTEYFAASLRLDSTQAGRGRTNLAWGYHDMRQGAFQSALRRFQDADRLWPETAVVSCAIGQAAENAGQLKDAREAFNLAIVRGAGGGCLSEAKAALSRLK